MDGDKQTRKEQLDTSCNAHAKGLKIDSQTLFYTKLEAYLIMHMETSNRYSISGTLWKRKDLRSAAVRLAGPWRAPGKIYVSGLYNSVGLNSDRPMR